VASAGRCSPEVGTMLLAYGKHLRDGTAARVDEIERSDSE
jgi:hypothetical protein